jgi:hypothetical protein
MYTPYGCISDDTDHMAKVAASHKLAIDAMALPVPQCQALLYKLVTTLQLHSNEPHSAKPSHTIQPVCLPTCDQPAAASSQLNIFQTTSRATAAAAAAAAAAVLRCCFLPGLLSSLALPATSSAAAWTAKRCATARAAADTQTSGWLANIRGIPTWCVLLVQTKIMHCKSMQHLSPAKG